MAVSRQHDNLSDPLGGVPIPDQGRNVSNNCQLWLPTDPVEWALESLKEASGRSVRQVALNFKDHLQQPQTHQSLACTLTNDWLLASR